VSLCPWTMAGAVALAAGASVPAPQPPAAEYAVTAAEGARELRVEVLFRSAPPGGLEFDDGAGRHVRDVEVANGKAWSAAVLEDDRLPAVRCDGGCRLRYRFLLDEATRGGGTHDAAFQQAGALVASPSRWLVRPAERARGRYRLHVETPRGTTFATGLFTAAGGGYEADLADLPEAPYSAFGPFEPAHIQVPGGEVEVAILPGETALGRAAILAWVERAAGDVAAYYGRYPLPRALVIVIPGGRRPVGFGTTMGNGGGSIMIWAGAAATEEDFRRDWVLTHEMSHFALPNVPRAQRWMEEGLATYVEPVARARRGHLTAEEVWADLVRKTPQGRPGEGGLDASRGFGAIYWGGALFWLLADVELRERSEGKVTLPDALAGIGEAGGSIAVTWPPERVLEAGDRATGMKVLAGLYARMARSADPVDLGALWKKLGIEEIGGRVVFDDGAPLAWIRKAITSTSNRPSARITRRGCGQVGGPDLPHRASARSRACGPAWGQDLSLLFLQEGVAIVPRR
jgi:predicted metalloprotease with PDZ domain